MSHQADIRTLAIHAGEHPDPVTRASSPNLVLSTTFIADPATGFSVEGLDAEAPYIYSRWGNPTVDQLEKKLATMEGAESAVAFGSGMAAITAVFLHLLSQGDHVIVSDITYAAASELCRDFLPRFGIEVTRVDLSDLDGLQTAIRPHTKLVYAETPCNPILRLTDIAEVGKIAHAAGAKLAVDSTFATPLASRPIELGADYVIHSLTKYLGGHGDAVGGAVLGLASDLTDLRKKTAIRAGGVLSPFNAWLILRGIATFPLRMRAHEEGALAVARYLESHPKVSRVIYPGLASHPQHELANRQMRNFSGMLTFQVKDGPDAAGVLAEHLKIIHYAVSLGHHRSLVFYLKTADLLESSFKLAPHQELSYRDYAGDGIFRLSVGIEAPQDLIDDLDQALAILP